MTSETVAWMLGAAAIVLSSAAACGGRSTGTAVGGGEPSSSSGGSNGGDSSGASGGGGGGVTCTSSVGGGGSSGAGGGCEVSSAGTCSDGTSFDINCSCPAGTCTCSKQTSSSGTQTSQVSIACPQACSLVSGDSLVQACNFGSSLGTVTPPADAGLPACTIPASMEPPSQRYAWSVGRVLLDCQGGGLGTICMSSDGITCPGDPVTVGSSCTDRCAPNEYAVGYGGPPTLNDDAGYLLPPLLASCNGNALGTPSGEAYACCPCD